ncbi:MAG: hypothetical protein ACK4R3_07475 [Aliihoeflea sp.]
MLRRLPNFMADPLASSALWRTEVDEALGVMPEKSMAAAIATEACP